MTLREALMPFLPPDALPIVIESIAAIETLPGLENWKPEAPSFLVASRLIHLGFPLSFVQRFPSLDPLRKSIGGCLRKGQHPSNADLAELQLAAFCSAIGAGNIENIPRENVPTPDFTVTWADNMCSDIEVVAGSVKTDQVERQQLGQTILTAIGSRDRSFDIIVHCAAGVTDRDIPNIVAAAQKLRVGDQREEAPNWEVRAEEIKDRDAYTIFVAGKRDLTPAWWDPEVISSFSFTSIVAGPGETKPKAQTRVVTGLPIRSYLNPVERKASYPQSKDEVFIIAFDISNLPGAFEELKNGLPGYFKIWDHVTGVLAFQFLPYAGITRCGWKRKFYYNPLCATKIPHELSSLDPTDDKIYETVCCLTESETTSFLATQNLRTQR